MYTIKSGNYETNLTDYVKAQNLYNDCKKHDIPVQLCCEYPVLKTVTYRAMKKSLTNLTNRGTIEK